MFAGPVRLRPRTGCVFFRRKQGCARGLVILGWSVRATGSLPESGCMSGSNPFLGVDHQVFVVADMGSSIEFWQGQLAIELQFRTTDEEYGVDQAFFTMPDGTFVELLAPTAGSSPVAKILEKQGEGLYLLAMKVANLASAIVTLQANGATVTGEGSDRVCVQPTVPGAPIIQLWPEDRPHRWRDNLATNTHVK